MLNFMNMESLASFLLEEADIDKPVSVVASKELVLEAMQELLTYDSVILDVCEVNVFDYDREYLLSLTYKEETGCWHIGVEQIYDYEKKKYFSTDGYVLFHEFVNSKALIDMQSNRYTNMKHDWFTFGEDDGDGSEHPESMNNKFVSTKNDNDEQDSESAYGNGSKEGTPEGFSKSRVTRSKGITCCSSYNHYNNDIERLCNLLNALMIL